MEKLTVVYRDGKRIIRDSGENQRFDVSVEGNAVIVEKYTAAERGDTNRIVGVFPLESVAAVYIADDEVVVHDLQI